MEAAPSGNLLYLNLPNLHANVVSMMIFHLASSCGTWSLHLQEKDIVFFFNFGNMLLNIDTLCTCLINGWLSLTGSDESLTLPFGFGTNAKMLQLSAVSSISCLCHDVLLL